MPVDYLDEVPRRLRYATDEDVLDEADRRGRASAYAELGYAVPKSGLGDDEFTSPQALPARAVKAAKAYDPFQDPQYKQVASRRKELHQNETLYRQQLADFDKTEGAALKWKKDDPNITRDQFEEKRQMERSFRDPLDALADEKTPPVRDANGVEIVGGNRATPAAIDASSQRRALIQHRQRLQNEADRITQARSQFDEDTFIPLRERLLGTRDAGSPTPSTPDYLAPEGESDFANRVREINITRRANGQAPIGQGSVSANRDFSERWQSMDAPRAAPAPEQQFIGPADQSDDRPAEDWPVTEPRTREQDFLDAAQRDTQGAPTDPMADTFGSRFRSEFGENLKGVPVIGSEGQPGQREPLVKIPHLDMAPDDSPRTPMTPLTFNDVTGAINALSDFASGFTTKENLGLMGALGIAGSASKLGGAIGDAARKAVGAAKLKFAADAAQGAGGAAGKLSVTAGRYDTAPGETAYDIASLGANAAMAATLGHSAAGDIAAGPSGETPPGYDESQDGRFTPIGPTEPPRFPWMPGDGGTPPKPYPHMPGDGPFPPEPFPPEPPMTTRLAQDGGAEPPPLPDESSRYSDLATELGLTDQPTGEPTNATTQGAEPQRAGTELPRTAEGSDIPEDGSEVRNGQGAQTDDGNRPVPSAEEVGNEGLPRGEEAERVAGEATGPRSQYTTTGLVFPTEKAALENASPDQVIRRTSGGGFEVMDNKPPGGAPFRDAIELPPERAKLESPASATPPPAAEAATPTIPEAVPTLGQDAARYQEIQDRWNQLVKEGKQDPNSPEVQALFRENEEIKNRHGGMPPELPAQAELPLPPSEPVAAKPFPSLLEFAKSRLPKATADRITSESQVESYRAQWEKERAAQPTPVAEAIKRAGWSDNAIAALQSAKIHKPGTTAAGTPLSLAWDGALETAIQGIKLGQKVGQVVEAAIKHFRDKFPEATEEHVSRLEKSITGLVRAREAADEPSVTGHEPTTEGPTLKYVETARANAPDIPLESVERDVVSNQERRANAKAFEDTHGAEAANKAFADSGTEEGGTANTVLVNAGQRMLDAVRALPAGEAREKALSNAQAFIARVGERAKNQGREVQALNDVNRWSEAGLVTAAVEKVRANRKRAIGDKGEAVANQIVSTVNDINAKGAEQVAADPGLIGDVKLTKEAVEKTGRKLKKGQPDLNAQIKGALKDMDLKLRDIIRKHYTEVDATGRTLSDRLVAEAGISGKDATALADRVQKRFRELTTEAKKKALDAQEKKFNEGGIERRVRRRGTVDKLIEASNLGALDSEQYLQMVAKDLKLKNATLTTEQARKLADASERIQKAPEGRQRNEAIIDALTELRRIEGVSKTDIATSIYYANILAGYTTQAKNLISTALNTTADIGALAVTNPREFAWAFRAIREGATEGLRQFARTEKTGYSDKGLARGVENMPGEHPNLQPLDTLEMLSRDPATSAGGAVAKKYAQVMRYVSRTMRGADAIFFEPAKSAFEYVAAAKLAKAANEGMPRKELNRKIRDMLAISPADFEFARTTASREGLKGLDYELRVAELIRQRRGKRVGGAQMGAAEKFAKTATFNDDTPRGYAGIAAEGINRMTKDLPAGKLIVPFTRIVANWLNATADYTPIGATRAVAGYTRKGSLLGGDKMEPWQRDMTLLKSGVGTAAMASLAAYALQGGGSVTGRGPADTNKRAQLRAAGWVPFSMKVNGHWTPYSQTPMALPLSIIGAWADAVNYDGLSKKDTGQVVSHALMAIPKTALQQSFMQGLSDAMDMVRSDDPGKAQRFAAGVAASAIPGGNMTQQIDRTIDPVLRDTGGVEGTLGGRVPGYRQTLPTVIDTRGRAAQGTRPYELMLGRGDQGDELDQWIAQSKNFISKGDRPSIGFGQKKRPATDQEYRQFQIEAGTEASRQLERLLPRLRNMKPDQAKETVADVVKNARASARIHLELAAHRAR